MKNQIFAIGDYVKDKDGIILRAVVVDHLPPRQAIVFGVNIKVEILEATEPKLIGKRIKAHSDFFNYW